MPRCMGRRPTGPARRMAVALTRRHRHWLADRHEAMDDRSHMRVRHGPSSGVMQDAPTTGRRAYGRHPYGVLLVVLGLLADSSAGLMILVNHDGWGLLVHIPAALGW